MAKFNIPLLAILGPTASGKTHFSLKLAEAIPAEIISGDSMQVYRDMNIGTAKATEEERKCVQHHLIDVVGPEERFNAQDFQERARSAVVDIYHRGRLPILVGGSGLYIQGLLYDLDFGGAPKNAAFRLKIEEEAKEVGWECLYERLKDLDPEACYKIFPKDHHRITRALEVIETTGERYSTWSKKNDLYTPCFILKAFALTMPRDLLYQRINERVDSMVEEGLFQEVASLMDKGISPSTTSLQGIGYKEVVSYYQKEISYDEAIERIRRNTRRFAKRQLTWFKRDPHIEWIDITQENEEAIFERMLDQAKRLMAENTLEL